MNNWRVSADRDNPSRGLLSGGGLSIACALGRGGVIEETKKTEGDEKTPLGRFPLRRILYRPDCLRPPKTMLPIKAIEQNMGWCDDIHHKNYNQAIEFPFDFSAERLWREDNIYNLILIMGHNDNPVIANRGSAIFIHIARDNYKPTLGCIAIKYNDLLKFIERIKYKDTVEIIKID